MHESFPRFVWRAFSHWALLLVLLLALFTDLALLARASQHRRTRSTVGSAINVWLPPAERVWDGNGALVSSLTISIQQAVYLTPGEPSGAIYEYRRMEGWLAPTRERSDVTLVVPRSLAGAVSRRTVEHDIELAHIPPLTDEQINQLLTTGSVSLADRPIYLGYLHNTLTLTLATLLLISLVRTPRRIYIERRTARRTRRGQCPTCAYDLAGITNTTCPECGSTAT